MNNDLISRSTLKEAISDVELSLTNKRTILGIIDHAPTVEERPQGEWLFVSRNCWKCPYCQELTNEGKNFCPNCGAEMQKGGAE